MAQSSWIGQLTQDLLCLQDHEVAFGLLDRLRVARVSRFILPRSDSSFYLLALGESGTGTAGVPASRFALLISRL